MDLEFFQGDEVIMIDECECVLGFGLSAYSTVPNKRAVQIERGLEKS